MCLSENCAALANVHGKNALSVRFACVRWDGVAGTSGFIGNVQRICLKHQLAVQMVSGLFAFLTSSDRMAMRVLICSVRLALLR